MNLTCIFGAPYFKLPSKWPASSRNQAASGENLLKGYRSFELSMPDGRAEALLVCILFEESIFIFQFLNNKMHSYVSFDKILHFIFQKLKNKHTFHASALPSGIESSKVR